MNRVFKVLTLVAIGATACVCFPAQAATARGSIHGFIKDGRGNPLVGAAVVIVAEKEDVEQVIKRANTNTEGKFIAAGILPGHYKVKAAAVGFKPVELAADVRANKVTIFDSILLRRMNTLAEETSLNADPKYAARRANSTIFQHTEAAKKPAEGSEATAIALTDRSPELHGFVQAFGQTASTAQGFSNSYVASNFAISEQLTRDANLVISGQIGAGENAPQRLEALTTAHVGDRHRVSVALGYARFTLSRRDAPASLGQFSVSATDTWQISGRVLVVYGMDFSRFTKGASGTSIVPRFGIAVDATARTKLFAALLPGSSVDEQESVNLESGEIVFSEPKPVAFSASDRPLMDSSYRLQFGGEQILSDRSSVEMMAFFDTVSGHGVGLLAIPVDGLGDHPQLHTAMQRGKTRGLRLVYKRHINKVLDGSVGYAFGSGQQLDARGISEPDELFQDRLFHVISAKVDANFISTGTKVSTVLRIAPEKAAFAIDPFQGQMATFDPNISLSLTQEIPNTGFIPGQWQAIVDLRNLLNQQSTVADEREELLASRYHRLIRVGVSVRF